MNGGTQRTRLRAAILAAILREDGQALVEYALILVLVSVTALGISPLGTWLVGQFGEVATAI
jgi:Flp pilus assembly pilin Flp